LSQLSDHDDEMSNDQLIIEQDIVEAFLSGRASPAGEWGSLAMFAEDMRVALNGAVPAPRSDLAVLLTTGFRAGSSRLVAAEATHVSATAALVARQPTSSRARALVSRVYAGLAAKIIGVAAAGVIAAGAFGVLPASAQHAVATAVSALTPLQFPDPAITHTKAGANRSGGVAAESVSAGGQLTGLRRAVVPPAAPQVPSSVPGPNAGGGSTGQDRAGQTPAARHAPTTVPGSNAGGGSTGQDRAGQTPASGHAPTTVGHP
jgi:hypothetical protein